MRVLFGLLLLALVALLQTQGSVASSIDTCPSENCVPSEMCEWPIKGGVCGQSGEVCCSLLRAQFRTLCRHHGGDCMDSCNQRLTRTASDCPADKVCCVLV